MKKKILSKIVEILAMIILTAFVTALGMFIAELLTIYLQNHVNG